MQCLPAAWASAFLRAIGSPPRAIGCFEASVVLACIIVAVVFWTLALLRSPTRQAMSAYADDGQLGVLAIMVLASLLLRLIYGTMVRDSPLGGVSPSPRPAAGGARPFG